MYPPAIDSLQQCDVDVIKEQAKNAPDTQASTQRLEEQVAAPAAKATAVDTHPPQSTLPHALSRQVASLRKQLSKKEAESMAATQQGRLKDQRLVPDPTPECMHTIQ